MYCIIYSFEINEGGNKDFEKAWKQLTQFIYKYEGSLGSRLHKESKFKYIAYAQWPNKERYKNAGSNLPDSADRVRQLMRESCSKIETLHELEVVDDLLKTSIDKNGNYQ